MDACLGQKENTCGHAEWDKILSDRQSHGFKKGENKELKQMK